MSARLAYGSSGEEIALADFNLIGRGSNATVRIEDTSVSREHATIRLNDGAFWINDLGSANGTFVNDLDLVQPRLLRPGDRIRIGSTVFTFSQDLAGPEPLDTIGLASETQVLSAGPSVRTTPMVLLVADIIGYSTLSTKVSADELAALIREWYLDCRQILETRGATIDKFIGDAVFSYWTDTSTSTRSLAVESARLLAAGKGDPVLSSLRHPEDREITTPCCVGLHLGDVAVGSVARGSYTALGDAVNLTFRIETLTRSLDRRILASDSLLDGWPEGLSQAEHCGAHQVKGYDQPVEVFAFS